MKNFPGNCQPYDDDSSIVAPDNCALCKWLFPEQPWVALSAESIEEKLPTTINVATLLLLWNNSSF